MNQSTTDIDSDAKKLWAHWKTYLWRWLVFGFVAANLQPTSGEFGSLWLQTLYLGSIGLAFGLVCTAVFTPIQNAFNTPRVRWKSWLTVIGTWTAVKFLFAVGFGSL